MTPLITTTPSRPGTLPARLGVLFATLLGLLLLPATPALAHGADAPDATNYRVTVTGAPDLPGVTVTAIEAGARLQVVNNSDKTVEVLGYSGEPYVEIRPDGVYENVNSPATYLNITLVHVDPPATADPTVPPVWNKVSDEPVYRWHDQRAVWSQPLPPAEVTAAPDEPRRLRDWTVPMRVGVTPLKITGVLDYVPPPSPLIWWGVSITGILAIAALGFLRGRWVAVLLSGLTIVAALISLTYAVQREFDAGFDSLWPIIGQLFGNQLWPVVTALCALTAAGYSLARPKASDFALALGSAAVALFAGMVNAAVFHRSVAPIPWGAEPARLMVVTVIALGGGAALACMLRLRALPAHAPAPANPNLTPDPHPTPGATR
jgi:hypothetical protein